MLRKCLLACGSVLLLAACARPWTETSLITPVSVWTSGELPTVAAGGGTATWSYSLPNARPPGAPETTPTPDTPHYQPGAARQEETYQVQPGDWLSSIAEKYGVSVEALIQANQIINPNTIEVGQVLIIPVVTPQPPGPGYKLLPDSDLVYGPLSAGLDIQALIQEKGGYLASYSQVVNGVNMDAAQVVQLVAQNYSVNPRLLLALLEYKAGWLTGPLADASQAEIPFGYIDEWYVGLYRQLAWASVHLNYGFYHWNDGSQTDLILVDGSVVPIDPGLNAGTVGVQNFLAHLDDYPTWLKDVSAGGFDQEYSRLFSNSFDRAIQPLVPASLTQPLLQLPFGQGETWSFTGGPHLSWDAGTPLGALDFAPPGEALGCVSSEAWVRAVADGLVTRTGEGLVVLDLDQDGNEGTGWVVIFMHIESRGRVQPLTVVRVGDPLGHPSCEGGLSSGTHVHMARKFNGVWIPAYGQVPFNLSGWVASGTGEEYVGTLNHAGALVEAFEGNSEINKIQR